MQHNTITYIIIGPGGRIFIGKYFLTQQTTLAFLISQVMLKQDILETQCRYLIPCCPPAKFTINTPHEQIGHKPTQLVKKGKRIKAS